MIFHNHFPLQNHINHIWVLGKILGYFFFWVTIVVEITKGDLFFYNWMLQKINLSWRQKKLWNRQSWIFLRWTIGQIDCPSEQDSIIKTLHVWQSKSYFANIMSLRQLFMKKAPFLRVCAKNAFLSKVRKKKKNTEMNADDFYWFFVKETRNRHWMDILPKIVTS